MAGLERRQRLKEILLPKKETWDVARVDVFSGPCVRLFWNFFPLIFTTTKCRITRKFLPFSLIWNYQGSGTVSLGHS